MSTKKKPAPKAQPKAKPAEALQPLKDEQGWELINDPEYNFEKDQHLPADAKQQKVNACVAKYGEHGIHRISNDYVGKMRGLL